MGDGWVRVVADVADDEVDLAGDALWQAGAAGFEEQATGGAIRLLAGFPDAVAGAAGIAALGALGIAARMEEVDDDGLDAWRAHARVERAGPFWLVPAWCADPEGVDASAIVRLDPGRTFGSGSHPTTRLVLAALARLVRPGHLVLDVGTGSGVLAVGAARLGAARVVAIDVDEASPAVVEANAAANGVGDRIEASTRPLAAVVASEAPADVVAANLLAPVLRELAGDLVAATAPHGALIASGLLADRWEAGVAALAPLEPVAVDVDEGWAAVTLARPAAPDR